MRQLTLDLAPSVPPTLDNFVVGANAALLAALLRQSTLRDGSWLYLWGGPASGRSHLLRASVSEAQAAGRPARYVGAAEALELQLAANELLALDDIEMLSPDGQAALFRAIIQAPGLGASLLLAGNAPPQGLALREDVRTRVGQALAFEIHALDDDARGSLLMQHALARGFRLDAEIIEYLLRHGRRDTGWLMAVLDALDHTSLSQARPVTLPLLREVLHADSEPELPF